MRNIIEIAHRLLTSFLYKIGIKKRPVDNIPNGAVEIQSSPAPQIITNASAIMVHHNDNVALVVDHEFKDVPGWIEWDIGRKRLSIAQMGGTITELETMLGESEIAEYRKRKKMYLIANYGGEKIIHSLSLIVRE